MSGLSSSRYKSPPAEPPQSSIFRKRARLSPAVSDPDLEGSWPLKRHVTEFYASDLNWACTTNTHDPAKPTTSTSAFAAFTGATSPLPIPSHPLPSLLNTSPPPGNEQLHPPRPSSASEHSMEEEVMLASGSSRMSTDMPTGGSPPKTAAATLQPSLEMPEEVTSGAVFPPSLIPAPATSSTPGIPAGACTMGTMGLPPIPSPVPGLSRRRTSNSMFMGLPISEASDTVPASPSDPGAAIMTNLRKTALLRSTSMLSMQRCLQASGTSAGHAQPPSQQHQHMQPHCLKGWSQQQQQQAAMLQVQQVQHGHDFRNWPPSAHQEQEQSHQHQQSQQQQRQQHQRPTVPQKQQQHQPPKQQEANQPWRSSAVSAISASSINAPSAGGAAFASSNHGPPSAAKLPLPTSPIAQSLAANHGAAQPAPQSTKPMLMHPSPRHFPPLNILTQMDRPEPDPMPFPLPPLGGHFCQDPMLTPAMDSTGLQQQEPIEDLPSAAPNLGSDAMSL
ncbi:hypothetical protein DUNSADRAFT_14512 [Dunaliella salina]|uniref:Uncharacterized protein n=1 Tax=Dunaliella salina TaxID=3046 RepID=A0ABQ7G7D9_DUNSA|nr:hypothetical protein DUNSADRAFT_14512 [Dunaliella salina]|eukprot:KAF5830509.1 hypothetical protein DUNSADRAFT_14512 [Dunaliella salina]